MIRYELTGAPAVVTVDVRTNGVSIGAARLAGMSGDVNRQVPVGNGTIRWDLPTAWPEYILASDLEVAVMAWDPQSPPDYMVVDLDATQPMGSNVWYFTEASQIPDGVSDERYKTQYLVLRKCPAAGVTWRMGRNDASDPCHDVTLSDDFYVGIYPCTQFQYQNVMGANPSGFQGEGRTAYPIRPVECVSYEMLRGSVEGAKWPSNAAAGLSNVDGTSFFGVLRARTGLAFDLPTDAQWEFACRAGTTTELNIGVDITEQDLARCAIYGTDQTGPVGTKEANAWGIYDMHGNVWEWCRDWYSALSSAAVNDPLGPESGTTRVIRPCGYNVGIGVAFLYASGFRNQESVTTAGTHIGFRIALPLEGGSAAGGRSVVVAPLATYGRTGVSAETDIDAFVSSCEASSEAIIRTDMASLIIFIH